MAVPAPGSAVADAVVRAGLSGSVQSLPASGVGATGAEPPRRASYLSNLIQPTEAMVMEGRWEGSQGSLDEEDDLETVIVKQEEAMGVAADMSSGGGGPGSGGADGPSSPRRLHMRHKSLLDLRREVGVLEGPAPVRVLLGWGRVIPARLLTTEMIAVSYPPVMRLLLNNQGALERLFHAFSTEEHLSQPVFRELAQLFSITPDVLSVEDLDEIFVLVNASEAADEQSELLDVEEFQEALVRVGVYKMPGLFDLESGDGLALAVEALFLHMNASVGAAKHRVNFVAVRKASMRNSDANVYGGL